MFFEDKDFTFTDFKVLVNNGLSEIKKIMRESDKSYSISDAVKTVLQTPEGKPVSTVASMDTVLHGPVQKAKSTFSVFTFLSL